MYSVPSIFNRQRCTVRLNWSFGSMLVFECLGVRICGGVFLQPASEWVSCSPVAPHRRSLVLFPYRVGPLRIVEIASAAPTVRQHLCDQWKPSTPYSRWTKRHMSRKPTLEPSSAHSIHLGRSDAALSRLGVDCFALGDSTLHVTDTAAAALKGVSTQLQTHARSVALCRRTFNLGR